MVCKISAFYDQNSKTNGGHHWSPNMINFKKYFFFTKFLECPETSKNAIKFFRPCRKTSGGSIDPHWSTNWPIMSIFELNSSFGTYYKCAKFQVDRISFTAVIAIQTDGRTDRQTRWVHKPWLGLKSDTIRRRCLNDDNILIS